LLSEGMIVASPPAAQSLAVGSDGVIWMVSTAGAILRYVGGGAWQIITAQLAQVVTVGSARNVWILDSGGNPAAWSPQDSTWISKPIATDLGASSIAAAADGTVLALDVNGHAWQYDATTGSWANAGFSGLSFVQVACGSASKVWCLDVGGVPLQGTTASVEQAPNSGNLRFSCLTVAADGTVFAIQRQTLAIYRYDGATWWREAQSSSLVSISAGSARDIWGHGTGVVYRRVPSTDAWTLRWNGSSPQIRQADVGVDGAMFGISTDDTIYRWTGSDWQPDTGAPTNASQLSVGNAMQVAVRDQMGCVWLRSCGVWQSLHTTGCVCVSVGADGTVMIVWEKSVNRLTLGNQWENISGSGSMATAYKSVAVGDNGHVLAVTASSSTVMMWTGSAFTPLIPDAPHAAYDIVDVGADGTALLVGTGRSMLLGNISDWAATQRSIALSESIQYVGVGSAELICAGDGSWIWSLGGYIFTDAREPAPEAAAEDSSSIPEYNDQNAAIVQTNLSNLIDLVDEYHDYFGDLINTAYNLIGLEQDDPGQHVLNALILKSFTAITIIGFPGAGIVAGVLSGSYNYLITSDPRTNINETFATLWERFSTETLALRRELSEMWSAPETYWLTPLLDPTTHATGVLADLALAVVPTKDSIEFEDMLEGMLADGNYDLWKQLLPTRYNDVSETNQQESTFDTESDCRAFMVSYVDANANYYLTYYQRDADWPSKGQVYAVKMHWLGYGLFPYAHHEPDASVCEYLFQDDGVGTIVRPDAVTTRATVFKKWGLPVQNVSQVPTYTGMTKTAIVADADAVTKQTGRARLRLDGARLSGAKLDGVRLRRARLAFADLRSADLSGADLSGAVAPGLRIAGAKLQGTMLIAAKLRGADLRGADLSRACFKRADLGGADLRGANLEGADFTGARLFGANLTGARLDGACFKRADTRFALGAPASDGSARLAVVASDVSLAVDPEAFLRTSYGIASLEGRSLLAGYAYLINTFRGSIAHFGQFTVPLTAPLPGNPDSAVTFNIGESGSDFYAAVVAAMQLAGVSTSNTDQVLAAGEKYPTMALGYLQEITDAGQRIAACFQGPFDISVAEDLLSSFGQGFADAALEAAATALDTQTIWLLDTDCSVTTNCRVQAVFMIAAGDSNAASTVATALGLTWSQLSTIETWLAATTVSWALRIEVNQDGTNGLTIGLPYSPSRATEVAAWLEAQALLDEPTRARFTSLGALNGEYPVTVSYLCLTLTPNGTTVVTAQVDFA
jgi:hypothetical protein